MTDHMTQEKWIELREKTETASQLSDKQFDQSMDYAKILKREIQAEGQFKTKLDGMAREFSLDAKFGAYTADKILRDQYKLRYGEEPNDHLQRLLENEKNLTSSDQHKAFECTGKITDKMEQQANPNFFRAFDRVSNHLASSLEITQKKARSLVVQTYKERHDQDFIQEFGKTEEKRICKSRGLSDKEKEPEQKKSNTMSV